MVCLAVFGAFEDGVFHEMGEAVFVGQLVTGACLHHKDKVGNLALFLFVYQPNAVGKCGFCVFVFQHGSKIGLQRYDNPKTFLHLHL